MLTIGAGPTTLGHPEGEDGRGVKCFPGPCATPIAVMLTSEVDLKREVRMDKKSFEMTEVLDLRFHRY